MTISQNDDASFSFTALQYEIGKFTATNNIAAIPKKEVSVIKAHVLTSPNSVSITERTRTHQGQAITTLVISWEQVVGAVAYVDKDEIAGTAGRMTVKRATQVQAVTPDKIREVGEQFRSHPKNHIWEKS